MSDNLSPEQQEALDDMREQAEAEREAEVVPHPSSTALVQQSEASLAITPQQQWWTTRQIAALSSIGLEALTAEHLQAFLHICQRTGLDPFAREIYYIGRKDDKAPGGVRYTAQTGIDGFRHLAERTGEYDGSEGPFWCGPDGQWHDIWMDESVPPVAAKVYVYRKGMARPVQGIAHYTEYVPMVAVWQNRQKVGEQPSPMWRKMPAHMLAKCAEALAFRKAFPREVAGVYTEDEMGALDARTKAERERETAEVRAEQRRQYVAGVGPGEPLSPAETAAGDVVTGEVVEALDRAALDAELDEQARVLGKTVAQHGTRWAAVHKRNITEATDEELEAFLASHRPRVAEKRAQEVADAVNEVAETTVIPDDDDEPETLPEAVVEADEPHPYQDWGGTCIVCGQPADEHSDAS